MKMACTWTRQSEGGKEPAVYVNDKGEVVKFEGHPTQAWCWNIYQSANRPKTSVANKVIEAYVEAGLRQHDFEGGFEEATRTLTT